MIRAILFDLDGTLVDTEPLHYAAFEQILAAERIKLSRDDYFARLIGYNDHDLFAIVLKENRSTAEEAHIAELIRRKAAVYEQMIRNRDVLYPGAERFVHECAQRFPLMLVTGTLRVEAETILGRAKLRDLFLDIIAAEDVEHGKPAPDGFVAALGRLGFMLRQRDAIQPHECLVIEDTPAGVEAGHRAGMRVLALLTTSEREKLADADLIRDSLEKTDLDDLLRSLSDDR